MRIVFWGIFSIARNWLNKYSLINIVFITTAILYLLTIIYFGLIGDLLLAIGGIILLLFDCMLLITLYQYNQNVQSQIQACQTIIDLTFETIHNGPLQNLAQVLRMLKRQDLSSNKLLPEIEKELEKINLDLRSIYEFHQQENLIHNENFYLGNSLFINLQDPLHDILYQVYSHTLERNFPCFKTLKVKVCNFEPINEQGLSLAHKRGICRFLEEALCNVGKYASGVTYLQVTCSASTGWQQLTIVDDGLGVNSSQEGWGTQQFKNLAQQIKGKFRRVPRLPKGTICELSWPLTNQL
ncbi:MAG TPA: sensor histidine kinase [Nostocaceae cyanobacterium]|nr:sensor histidine kinase [Nostocaceae cyanobacterium]